MPQLEAVPSSQLVAEDNAEETTTSTTAAKLKEFVIRFPGTYRCKFNLGVGANTNGYAAIYVNAVKKGAIRVQRTAGDYSVQVEDIGGLKVGDLLQLYAWHTNGTSSTSVDAFSISASYQQQQPPIPGTVN